MLAEDELFMLLLLDIVVEDGAEELHDSGDESSTFLVNSEMSASVYIVMNGSSSS